MALALGTMVLVRYDTPVFHERLICGQVRDSDHVVCSPTYDFFVEQLDLNNDDLTAIRFYQADGTPPAGVNPAQLFQFPGMTAAQRTALLVEGVRLANVERRALGLVPDLAMPGAAVAGGGGGGVAAPAAGAAVPPAAPPGAPPVAGAAAPLVAAPAAAPPGGGPILPVAPGQPRGLTGPGGAWVVDEPSGTREIGDGMPLPANAQVVGTRALADLGNEVVLLVFLPPNTDIDEYARARQALLTDDDRIIPLPAERRAIDFKNAVEDMIEDAKLAFPLEGERSAPWFLNEVVKSGVGTLTSRSTRWSRESGIDSNSRLAHEHKVISRALDFGITCDGLNCKNLVITEYLLRRMQLIEEVHREDPKNPNWEGSDFYMGTPEAKGGALLAPGLRRHVAEQLSREAAILKEKRKARDARRGAKDNKAPAAEK